MLDVEFKIKNYRCFGDAPTSFRFRQGFTALVGVNGSGKSSLLRLIYEMRPFLAHFRAGDPQFINTLNRQQSQGGFWAPNILPGERIWRADANRPVELEIIVHDGPEGPLTYNGERVSVKTQYSEERGGTVPSIADGSGNSPGTGDAILSPLYAAFGILADAMYIGSFRNAIHVGGNANYYDIRTGDAFISTFDAYKSGNSARQNEAVHQMLRELRRIFEFDELDINPSGQTLQLTINGRSYRLSEQGSGLAHFIVTMVNVLVRRPSLLLIDEPELNLHASLQLDFLQTLARYTDYGVVFATHSLGLARTAADRIYTVTRPRGRDSSQLSLYEDTKDLVTLLGQLSFDGRPEMGFNRVLLVEGKTELRTLMQLLKLYAKEHEVLMLPLHGASLIHPGSCQEIAELLRVGGDVRYLIDSEREAGGDPLDVNRQGFVEMCEQLKIPGHVLERRALENYFPDAAVKRAFGISANALSEFEKLGKASGMAWRKTDNWRVAAEMRRADLDHTDLGRFLESL